MLLHLNQPMVSGYSLQPKDYRQTVSANRLHSLSDPAMLTLLGCACTLHVLGA